MRVSVGAIDTVECLFLVDRRDPEHTIVRASRCLDAEALAAHAQALLSVEERDIVRAAHGKPPVEVTPSVLIDPVAFYAIAV